MKKLLQYLGNYKKESILGPLFKLLEASFELIVPLVMAAIIDTGVANADRPYIMKMSLVLFLLALIGLTCAITAQYFAAERSSCKDSSAYSQMQSATSPIKAAFSATAETAACLSFVIPCLPF